MGIGVDIDDVTCEFVGNYLKYHNKRFGTNFSFENTSKHLFWEDMGLTSSEIQPLFGDFHRECLPLENFPLFEGAKETISSLSENNEIFFITSRPEKIMPETKKFLDKNFSHIKFKLIHSGEIYGKNKTKADICKDNGINVLIEDSASFCLECSKKGIKTFLFDQPWNRDFNESQFENITRVKNWEEISEKVR
jgi:uncharacterized HAD superfamily protein